MNRIITISRQYATGGREIGRIIGEHYGIPVYDNDLISLAAKRGLRQYSISGNAAWHATRYTDT